jgi:uncharacterized protein
MRSALYEGRLRHARYRPRPHGFGYGLFFVWLDLAELKEVFKGRLLWSAEGPNLAWFRRADHFGDPAQPLDEAVRALVAQSCGARPEGPVCMLAHLRYFGHNFNPASFYYCYDKAGEKVEHIVVEVHNTPWGERHCYVLSQKDNLGTREEKLFKLRKIFTVSPFLPMDINYEWSFTEPGEQVRVRMKDFDAEGLIFQADLALERRPLDGRSLAGALLRYPLVTVKVFAGIYWQALRLWLKKTPFYGHAANQGKGDAV